MFRLRFYVGQRCFSTAYRDAIRSRQKMGWLPTTTVLDIFHAQEEENIKHNLSTIWPLYVENH